jgi:hypothetical protein
LIGVVVGQKETSLFSSQAQMGVQLSCPGIVAKTLTYRGELAEFNLNVENFGGYEIKVNVDKEVTGDTGYFITWLDKKGFTVGPWESDSNFNLYVLARFKPEPGKVEEIDITVTISSGIYQDTMTFHVELVDDSIDDDVYYAGSSVDASRTPDLCSIDSYVSAESTPIPADKKKVYS